MDFQVTFVDEQDAIRGKENFVTHRFNNVSRNGKRVHLTNSITENPLYGTMTL